MGAGTPDGIDVLGLGALVFSISGSLEPFNCQYKRDTCINFLILHFNSFSTKTEKFKLNIITVINSKNKEGNRFQFQIKGTTVVIALAKSLSIG